MAKPTYTFIDLFAGIGGFHQALHKAGCRCVFACEWNKYARISYEYNYKKISPNLFDNDYRYFANDINDVNPSDIPDFDICCAGFPCQPFSMAGKRLGFEDTRGTLFFNIVNIVKSKIESGCPPKILLLENVKGLKNHQKGQTLKVILETLSELGYDYRFEVLNAKNFGLPQNRERLFIVAWFRKIINKSDFKFPLGVDIKGTYIFDSTNLSNLAIKTSIEDILEPNGKIDPSFTISDKMWAGHQARRERNIAKGNGFSYSLFKPTDTYTNTIVARYWKDGKEILIEQDEKGLNPRKITPTEAGRLQGYYIVGSGWKKPNPNKPIGLEYSIIVSKKEAYQQFGNSVAIPVVSAIGSEIISQLLK